MHVFDQMNEVGPIFDRHGIEWDLAEFEGQQLSEVELLEVIHRYDAVLAGDDELTGKVLGSAPRLKVVAKWGIGIDNIDTDAAVELGIEVLNTPGVFGDEIADYALTYILLLFRQQHEIDRQLRRGEWPKLRGHSLAGHMLGIVGLGSSGRALARRGRTLGMRLVGADVVLPPDDFVEETDVEMLDIDELFARSDVVSLHTPLTNQTGHLVDAQRLRAMPPGSYLVNTARGPLVDEVALIEALRSGHLAGAALDVFEQEPLSPDSPLRDLPNVILGSHNASNTYEAVVRTTRQAVENVLRGLGYEL